jgi:hypothetical protein
MFALLSTHVLGQRALQPRDVLADRHQSIRHRIGFYLSIYLALIDRVSLCVCGGVIQRYDSHCSAGTCLSGGRVQYVSIVPRAKSICSYMHACMHTHICV